MCGIVGFVGHEEASKVLLSGLKKLEYRGYDSAGMAVSNEEGQVNILKATGKLSNLIEKSDDGEKLKGKCGIGHTRWATHGEANEKNAHPHVSGAYDPDKVDYSEMNVVGVHNGIIENYKEIAEKLKKNGYKLYSDTDTEVGIKLVDYYYNKNGKNPIEAINRMMVSVRGSYAMLFMFKDYPGEIYAARKDSPMIIGVSEGESYLASDVPAILEYTRNVYYIGNQQSARILPGEVTFYDINGEEISLECKEIKMDAKAAGKNGHKHYMMKEIYEQPQALRDTLDSLVKKNKIDLSEAGLTDQYIRSIDSLYIVACGSAWHVGMVSQYVIEDMVELPVRVELASEFRYRKIPENKNALVIIISQSGETADSLEALKIAKQSGMRALGIVNVEGSSIAREADNVVYTKAGPEIAVATTKAFTAQLMVMYVLATKFAYVRGNIDDKKLKYYIKELQALPDKVSELLAKKERIQWIASRYANATDAFFIGRGSDYAISMEGSLKLKEISYIHSEAYAAGELKHGTISLIEDNTLLIGVLTQKKLMEKTISNMKECKSRGAYLVGVTYEGDESLLENIDFLIYIPESDEHFSGIISVIPLQLLGYYISVSKGLDVDKPRNLAKSVTVE
ncbi:MAG: glutamine--fructose-6-phosphate transaminase (isomerizing) [Eubacterium sp.]|nr:glutamine--fructose-6-phosphate transaminase (isomerizing) [Eubacterium sp.]